MSYTVSVVFRVHGKTFTEVVVLYAASKDDAAIRALQCLKAFNMKLLELVKVESGEIDYGTVPDTNMHWRTA